MEGRCKRNQSVLAASGLRVRLPISGFLPFSTMPTFKGDESDEFGGLVLGGLFLEPSVSPSYFSSIESLRNDSLGFWGFRKPVVSLRLSTDSSCGRKGGGNGLFLSVGLSIKGSRESLVQKVESERGEAKVGVCETREKRAVRVKDSIAVNTTKHLWAGAVAAMVSRTFVAPLERLKLEYILRGEKSNLFVLIKKIADSQGLKGFWKGNFVNILRTAPFKAVNFYAYDTYRKQLMRLTGHEEITNVERFVAGAAAGITATVLCIPMDTIRTKLVAPGGEALGGVIGACRHMIQSEGFFSLYKGLGPSIISMAPSGAVFYGVYDILKSAYLQSPEGKKRILMMKQQNNGEVSALDKLELGPVRTLLHGAIAGACAEAATYPFEVVRRQMQMQVQATRMTALATCVNIVERGGIPALYAGLIPSLLQVLPSAAISYFVYEFMKIVLIVE